MIVLASQSPRRAELLRQVGVAFRARPADIDESPMPGESPEAYVRRMSVAKASAVRRAEPQHPVLGSDTAVVLDGRVFGKPADREQAVAMLLTLAGRTHQVMTGVALVDDTVHYRLSTSTVRFRAIDRAEALAYWASGEPVDKAGGYAIQGLGAAFVSHIDGSFSGVMGLPLFETLELCRHTGIRCALDV
jgi:septum formation protein